jgi:ABC-2 type transport system permease protein
MTGVRVVAVVARQTLRARARALAVWSLALMVLIALQLAAFPSVQGAAAGMEELLRNYPAALQEAFGLDTFMSGAGFVHAEVFTLMAPLVLTAIAVSAGAGGTAQEEETGTADLLFTTPVTRAQVLAGKAVAMLAAVTGPALVLLATLAIGGRVVDLEVPFARLAAAVTMTWLLAVVFGGVAVLVGAATGRRAPAVATAVAAGVAAFLGNVLGGLADWLSAWRSASPFRWAVGTRPVENGLDMGAALGLVAVTVALVLAAVAMLSRRDLRGR